MEVYAIYAANIEGTLIDGVSEQGINPGLNLRTEYGDGSPWPTLIAPISNDPRIPFGTTQILTALTKLGVTGGALGSSAIFFCQKMTEIGRDTTGHMKATVASGIVRPVSLNAEKDGIAVLQAETICTYDGTNNPIVFATGQSLSGTPAPDEAFTVGPVKINNTWLDSVESIRIEFGINVGVYPTNGEPWARKAVLLTQEPVITVTTHDVSLIASLGLAGNAAGANSYVYFRRIKTTDTSMRYADNTASHVKIAAQGRIHVRDIGQNPQMATLEIRPWKVAGSAILVATLGATIA